MVGIISHFANKFVVTKDRISVKHCVMSDTNTAYWQPIRRREVNGFGKVESFEYKSI